MVSDNLLHEGTKLNTKDTKPLTVVLVTFVLFLRAFVMKNGLSIALLISNG